eukprot:CAMPEP_0197650406 /NCGR_PEP_ID=MMETSP1338-20131121/30925_1 /TAXON_ID=43686 ORGANISM="Pelagodinium beii, Strain RCC1491" /NCGR_SAMPLE_ID=MMETSP1338 /ASSEMBLY_ACC=CAM_ASM_000754 /LENGTH=50 /DNA_ID=CAMNT_0043224805 /DNA_START=32 /DNA_END=181 /DNA_ORIENTATION=+
MADQFAQMDANNDGVVSREEFMFAQMDANGDGQISREEFAAAMSGQAMPA